MDCQLFLLACLHHVHHLYVLVTITGSAPCMCYNHLSQCMVLHHMMYLCDYHHGGEPERAAHNLLELGTKPTAPGQLLSVWYICMN